MPSIHIGANEESIISRKVEFDIIITGVSIGIGYTGAVGGVIVAGFAAIGQSSTLPANGDGNVLAQVMAATSFDTAAGHSGNGGNVAISGLRERVLAGEYIQVQCRNITGNPGGTVQCRATFIYERVTGR